MPKNFEVNIILKVLEEGLANVSRLFSNLAPTIDKSKTATDNLNQSAKDTIDTFEKLSKRQQELLRKGQGGLSTKEIKAKEIPKIQLPNLRTPEEEKEFAIINKAVNDYSKVIGSAAKEAEVLKNLQNQLINEGVKGYKKVVDSVKQLSSAISALDDIEIGGTESLKRLQKLLSDLKKGADIKLEVDTATAIQETLRLEKNIKELLDQAAQEGDLEGFGNLSQVISQVQTARKEVEKLVAERLKLDAKPVEIRLRIKEEGTKVREELSNFKKEFETAKAIGLAFDFRGEGANKRLNELIDRIKILKQDAKSIGQDTLEFDIELGKIQGLKDELTRVGKRKDALAREAINIKVTNIADLKKLDQEARKLLVDLDAAKKAGNIDLVAKLDVDRGDLQTRLQDLRKPIDDLAQSTKKTGLVDAFEEVVSKLNAAEKSVKSFDDEAVQSAINVQQQTAKLSSNIAELSAGARKLKKDLDEAFRTGATGAKSGLSQDAESLLSLVDKIKNSAERISNKQLAAFRALQGQIGNSVERLENLTEEGVKAGNDIQESIAKLNGGFSRTQKAIASVTQEFKKAQQLGNSADIAPKLQLRTDEFIQQLEVALAEAQRLGEKGTAKGIRLELENLGQFKSELEQANAQADLLRKQEISAKVSGVQDVNQLNKDVNQLAKDVETANRKGNIKIRPELELRAEDIRRRIEQLRKPVESLGQTKVDLFAGVENRFADIESGINRIDKLTAFTAEQEDLNARRGTRNLKELATEAKRTYKQIELAVKQGNFTVVSEFQFKKDSLDAAIRQIENSTESLSAKDLDIFRDLKLDADKASTAFERLQKDELEFIQQSRIAEIEVTKNLERIRNEANLLTKDVEKATAKGAFVLQPELNIRKDTLLADIKKITATGQPLNKTQFDLFTKLLVDAKTATSAVDNFGGAATKAGEEAQQRIAELSNRFDKAKSKLSGLNKEFEKVKEIGTTGKVSGSLNRELDATIAELKELINLFDSVGKDTKTIRVKLVEAEQTKKDLSTIGTLEDQIARNKIRIEVDDTKELKNLQKELGTLLRQVEQAEKSGNLSVRDDLLQSLSTIQVRINQIKDPIDSLNDVGKIKAFEGLVSDADKLKQRILGLTQASTEFTQEVNVAAKRSETSLAGIALAAKKTIAQIKKAAQDGNFAIKGEVDIKTQDLADSIRKVENSGESLSPQRQKLLIAAKAALQDLVEENNRFTEASVRAGRVAADDAAQLARSYKLAGEALNNLKTQLKEASKLGEATKIKPQLELATEELLAALREAFAEAERLGKNTQPIRLRILEAEDFLDDVRKIDKSLDNIANRKIAVKAVLDAEFKEVDAKISALNKELDIAAKKGDIRVVVKLQGQIDEAIRDLQRLLPLVEQTQNLQQKQKFEARDVSLGFAQKRLDELSGSVDKGLPGFIQSVGRSFRLAAQDAGGARGAITGLASTLRLVGTSAFLVGGELRTLGFGFSALANIVQNIGPVFFQFGASLAKAGPPGIALLATLTAIGTTAAVVATKLVLLIGALGALVSTGFEYNTALEQTRNASAALAAEFFDFTVNGEKVNETIQVGGQLLTKYQVAQKAVEDQFAALQNVALTTIFTNKELLGTFQNIIVASNGLAPSIESVTALTGQFARVAGLLGLSADKLASQVNLVLSGAGRVTSPLQRFLNAAKDSQGIALTAKRIRELRAEGGEVLFGELTSAISKFDEALKKANRASLTGVLSNYQDLFEQVSQLATKSLFDGLRDGLGLAIDNLFQKVAILKKDGTKLTDKAGNVQFTEKPAQSILDIANTASKLFDVINRDILKLVNYLIAQLPKFARFLEDNYKTIVNIYESLKQVLTVVGRIILAFTRLFTLSSDTNSELKATVTILDTIAIAANGFRGVLDVIGIVVNSILVGLGLIPRLLIRAALAASRLKDETIGFGIKSDTTKKLEEFNASAKEFVDNRENSVIANTKDLLAAGKESRELFSGKTGRERNEIIVKEEKQAQVDRINEQFKNKAAEIFKSKPSKQRTNQAADLFDKQTQFNRAVEEDKKQRLLGQKGIDLSKFEDKLNIESFGKTGSITSDADKKGRTQRNKSELADTRALSDAIKALGLQREQNQLKLVQDRLAQEATLYQDLLDQNLISQQESSAKILSIKNQEIDNEIQLRKNALELISREREAQEKAFIKEEADIKANVGGKDSAANVQIKLSNLNLKQATERTKNRTEELKLEGEIQALILSRNVALQDYRKIQQQITNELVKQVDAQRSTIDGLIDANTEESLRLKTLDLVREKIEDIENIRLQTEAVTKLQGLTTDEATLRNLNLQAEKLEERRRLLIQEVDIRQNLLRLQASENLLETTRNKLASRENFRQIDVARGVLDERKALIEATAERIKYAKVLEQVIEAQEEILKNDENDSATPSIANDRRREGITRLREELANLKTTIDDSEIIGAVNNIRDSFVDLFDRLQENIGNATNSFADFGKSVLGIFRRLISEKIVRELFGNLFNTPGQTQGQATGIFGGLLKKIGLGNDQDQAKAEKRAQELKPLLSPKEQALLDSISANTKASGEILQTDIKNLSAIFAEQREPYRNTLQGLLQQLEAAGTRLGVFNAKAVQREAESVINKTPRVGNSGTTDETVQKFGESPQSTVEKLINQDKQDSENIKAAIAVSSDKVSNAIVSDAGTIKPISIADSGSLIPALSQYFSALNNNIQLYIGGKLDQIISILPTLAGQAAAPTIDISGAAAGFGEADFWKGGQVTKRKRGGPIGFISGGAVDGQGGIREDAIPARLSNGEYVIQAPIVKLLGKDFMDKLNSGQLSGLTEFAGGGLLRNIPRTDYLRPAIDSTRYNYTGGGASLINKPAPIVEPPKPKPKKVGGFRKIFGGILSAVAPFLNFIPGIGPFLALGAGAAGGALSGNNAKESILGGIFGGLGNLGGFSGSGGFLGKLGGFFGSDKGKLLTGILGGSSGNSGLQAGAGGNSILALLQRLGLFKKKKSNGGIIQNLASGGLSGIFGGLKDIFGKVGGSFSSIFSKGARSSSSGNSNNLLALFGLSSLLGGLTGGGNSQQESEFQEVVVEDPDAERKNKYGSAYNPLIEEGLLPGYQYSPETLAGLIKQEEGFRNIVRKPKQGLFGKILGGLGKFLPAILGILSAGGGSSGKFVDSLIPGSGGNKFGDVLAANGGLIKMFADGGKVSGAGTSTSDSILSLLSNGEYVIQASAVRMLGTDVLESINAGRFKFAEGGLVGTGVASLPEARPTSSTPNVNVNMPPIYNVFDTNIIDTWARTPEGQNAIINLISRNKRTVRETLR